MLPDKLYLSTGLLGIGSTHWLKKPLQGINGACMKNNLFACCFSFTVVPTKEFSLMWHGGGIASVAQSPENNYTHSHTMCGCFNLIQNMSVEESLDTCISLPLLLQCQAAVHPADAPGGTFVSSQIKDGRDRKKQKQRDFRHSWLLNPSPVFHKPSYSNYKPSLQ